MARSYCQQCSKPESACLCQYLSPQANGITVIILQHPDEKMKAIGTAKLVVLGLIKSKILTTIELNEAELRHTLTEFTCLEPLLIYPQSLSNAVSHYVYDFEKERFTSLPLQKSFDSIILLDGTWRNTRELLHRNPWLKNLPTLNLANLVKSNYRIRQAKKTGALATIEAVSYVLALLDNNFQPEKLLKPFEKMIEFQIEKMGQDVYQNNYLANNKNNEA
jgi:DTW domain-containing protein YfiP